MTDFHVLYESYAPLVRRFALFLCGEPALADDITSETFVRAWTAPGPIREETVKAYLFTIARRLYLDSLRQTRRHTVLTEALPDKRVRVQEQAEMRSELRSVLAAMQQLPELDRTVLLMRAQSEMSYAGIASELGLSIPVVKVRIHRARLRLMQLMNVHSEGPSEPEKNS
jgi:RNA polymerase sigma-70 factor (ECF subfamily)